MTAADLPVPRTRSEAGALLGYGDAFLFVDEILAIEPGATISTVCHYSEQHPILLAHFAGGPAVVPGVILVEQICQSARLLALLSEFPRPGTTLLLGEARARFHLPAAAPCLLRANVQLHFQAWDSVAFEGIVMCEDATIMTTKGIGTYVDRKMPGTL